MAMTSSFTAHRTRQFADSWPRLNFDIPDGVLAEVDFKWLMAGHGWHVDVARLHIDAPYAAQMLGKAMGSEFEDLRDSAATLSAMLKDSAAH